MTNARLSNAHQFSAARRLQGKKHECEHMEPKQQNVSRLSCCRFSRGELKEKIQVPLRVSFFRARLTSWWLLTREKRENGWSVCGTQSLYKAAYDNTHSLYAAAYNIYAAVYRLCVLLYAVLAAHAAG